MKVLKVAKSGKNAETSTNPNDFIFHSGYNTFKIITSGLLTNQTVDANPKTFTVAHNQGHVPAFYAFAQFPDGKTAMPDNYDFSNQYHVSTGYGQFKVQADITNLYFIFTRNVNNYNVNIKYYIFETPLV